jgi:hypothetical protein
MFLPGARADGHHDPDPRRKGAAVKIRITIKDPDAIADATLGLGARIRSFAGEHLAWMFSGSKAGEVDDLAIEEAQRRIQKWARDGEHFVVEIDLAKDTATIITAEQLRHERETAQGGGA